MGTHVSQTEWQRKYFVWNFLVSTDNRNNADDTKYFHLPHSARLCASRPGGFLEKRPPLYYLSAKGRRNASRTSRSSRRVATRNCYSEYSVSISIDQLHMASVRTCRYNFSSFFFHCKIKVSEEKRRTRFICVTSFESKWLRSACISSFGGRSWGQSRIDSISNNRK